MLAADRFRGHDRMLASLLLRGTACWDAVEPLLAFRHLSWLPLYTKGLLILLYACGICPKEALARCGAPVGGRIGPSSVSVATAPPTGEEPIVR